MSSPCCFHQLDRLEARAGLRYVTASEIPALREDEVDTEGPDSARLKSPPTSADLEENSRRSEAETVIDEYQLVEFAETEVESE